MALMLRILRTFSIAGPVQPVEWCGKHNGKRERPVKLMGQSERLEALWTVSPPIEEGCRAWKTVLWAVWALCRTPPSRIAARQDPVVRDGTQ